MQKGGCKYGKQFDKIAAIVLVLIMTLTQLLVAFASSEAETGLANANSESEIRRTISKELDKSSNQRRTDLTEEKKAEEKQVLQEETAS